MDVPKIDSYRFGRIVIDSKAYEKDVILLPERVIAGWWRLEGHRLHPQDLLEVLADRPEVLVVGQGAYVQMQVTAEARQALEQAGIELVSLPTEQACRRYNELRTQRKTAAALHLTC